MWEENLLEILKFNARNIRFDEKVTKVCCHQDSVAVVLGFCPRSFWCLFCLLTNSTLVTSIELRKDRNFIFCQAKRRCQRSILIKGQGHLLR